MLDLARACYRNKVVFIYLYLGQHPLQRDKALARNLNQQGAVQLNDLRDFEALPIVTCHHLVARFAV